MPTINQLSGLSQLSSGDLLPIYVPNNGDARKVSIGQLLAFFQQQFASPTLSPQLATPGTGFNVAVQTPVSEQQWLILQPAGTLASGTVTLPLNTQTPDGTEVLITTTQQITAFALALNGAAAAYGAPSTLSAEDFFRVRYYAATNSWYRIS
jgi:hypothetical protein